MAWEVSHRKGGPHDDDQGREAGATKEEAQGEDLLGCATGLPVPTKEVLSVRVDQVRQVLVGNILWSSPGRICLRHPVEVFWPLEERWTYSKVRNTLTSIGEERKPCSASGLWLFFFSKQLKKTTSI